MVVNDNARDLDKRGALESIAGKPAPTDIARSLLGAGLPTMVVNDNAIKPDKRGARESIASKLAPTDITRPPVGASLLAMVVNDNACDLDKRGAPESIASSSRLLQAHRDYSPHALVELKCPALKIIH
jgi:hypothetical protein